MTLRTSWIALGRPCFSSIFPDSLFETSLSCQLVFLSHSGVFSSLISWGFHVYIPPCFKSSVPHVWAHYSALELLAAAKYTKFCCLDAVEYRKLLRECFRRRCVELSRHDPVLVLVGYTPLPHYFFFCVYSQQTRREVCEKMMIS